ncbi:MAG: hypothetical protein QOC92_2268 [Acidimicrobiaceae bacterium]
MRRSLGSRRQKWVRATLGLGSLGAAGLLVALFAMPVSAGSSSGGTAVRAKATTVNVTATEFKFKLSKTKVPVGKVTFKVTNRGKVGHDFKIAGKKTKLLAPGKSATLTVTFSKSGRIAYTCTVAGHAAAGMKGVLAVGKATVPPPVTTTTRVTTTVATTTATPPPGSVPIQVLMNEYTFKLSQTSVAAGTTVFFTVVNQGVIDHNFGFPSLGVTTPNVPAGGTSTLTVTFKTAGSIYYVCNLPQHAEAGMSGFFTVTG